MTKLRNLLSIKGGGYTPVPPDVVVARANLFVVRRNHCSLRNLKSPWREAVAYTLVECHGLEFQQVADALGVTARTAKNYWQTGDFLYNATANVPPFCVALRDYIIYNARYIPR